MTINIATFIHKDSEIQSATMLFSLILNSKSKLNIYITHRHNIDKNKFKFISKFGDKVNLEFIQVNYITESENIIRIPSLISEDKLIYLKCNCMVLKDLTELYNKDVSTIALSQFNTAVLLLNMNYLSNSEFIKEAEKYINKYNEKKIFDSILGNNITHLSVKFNLPNEREILDNMIVVDGANVLSRFEEINNPYIISYTKIPWTIRYVLYQDIWKQYYKEYNLINNM